MNKVKICFALAFLTIILHAKAQFEKQHEDKLKWFQDSRFGLFIHWDMSSVAGTEISWSRGATKPLDITGDTAGYVEDKYYDNLYKRFNPSQFNASEWVDLAKKAGMKYIVFTAKHHGGFCMWNTKMTNYSIMHTTFARDVLKELSDACHKAGLGFGIYYSQRDWHQPDYGIGDNRKYIDYMNGEIRELMTNYGKVDIMWWDSYGKGDLTSFWHIDETYKILQEFQPGILMNDRMAELGDYGLQPALYRGDWNTPEQRLGNFQNTRPWESCMTLIQTPDGGGWSFRKDGKLRSYSECVRALISCATGDGNLLLDAGPDSTGKIPSDQSQRLLQMGAWLRAYGKSIYKTRGGPFINGKWGGSTFRDKNIYLHIFNWKQDKITLPPLPVKILRCSNMTTPGNIPVCRQNENGITIELPVKKQDKIDTIIVLETSEDVKNIQTVEVQ